ncbi:MAG: hypothetical protein ACE5HY_05460 [Candidatus Hydrothermarchaeales archaeon]
MTGKSESKPKIVNIVATGSFPKSLDIVDLYSTLDVGKKEYEPETYPALLVKVKVGHKDIHVTLYGNGKYIIAGANSEKELMDAYNEIYKKLQEAGAL